MKKKLFFFLFLFLTFSKIVSAEASSVKEPYCNNQLTQPNLKNLDKVKIKDIEINFKNNRKWTKNGIKILIGNFRFVPEKYKKRFKASVTVNFENNLKCNFKARIRFQGDQKDHIAIKDNALEQSIDVHLMSGHIYGITKFKLLREKTRGKLEDEIFLMELLKQLNYLAPRTMYVNTKISGFRSKMIFQEKAVKELLEYNQRREGPIYEGDERFVWRLAQKVESNQLGNHAVGLLPLIDSGFKSMLARQVNTQLISRSKNHSLMSSNALSNLNLAYLLYNNMYNESKINQLEKYRFYTLNNDLLGFYEPENILKLDVYNLLILSGSGNHGLAPNNRKFYWNSIENYFEPITYDTMINIDTEPTILLLPVSNQIMAAFSKLENLLDNINVSELSNKLKFRNINLNINDTKKKS